MPGSGSVEGEVGVVVLTIAGVIGPWADFLFNHCEVIHPVFNGDEAEVREYHEENLKTCQGALIFYGAGNEVWLRRKLRELQKSAG